jgi:hypothetical protein
MKEPLGYRILARRLARDLEACVDANDRAQNPKPPFLYRDEFDRRFTRARRTLKRFAQYEATHRRRARS